MVGVHLKLYNDDTNGDFSVIYEIHYIDGQSLGP